MQSKIQVLNDLKALRPITEFLIFRLVLWTKSVLPESSLEVEWNKNDARTTNLREITITISSSSSGSSHYLNISNGQLKLFPQVTAVYHYDSDGAKESAKAAWNSMNSLIILFKQLKICFMVTIFDKPNSFWQTSSFCFSSTQKDKINYRKSILINLN